MNPDYARVWHIITGEYPPAPGGVSDYTALIANGLSDPGFEVHIWCPQLPEPLPDSSTVILHQLREGFSQRGLKQLTGELNRFDGSRTLLVQYVYNAFGCRGMNVPFCLWLIGRRYWHGDDVRVMFHEPFYSFGRQSVRRNILAAATHLMAALLLIASRTVYLSIPAWERLLRPWNWLARPMIWLPIPATIPGGPPPVKTMDRRRPVVGHFGTYGEQTRRHLLTLFTLLLTRCPEIELRLLGGGGTRFGTELSAALPNRGWRIVAFDRLPSEDVAAEIRGCDVMLQYYPDGVSSRRTSVMACLANGVPVVTTHGLLTEPIWADSQAVEMAPADNLDAVVTAIARLFDVPEALSALGARGADLYESRFSLDRSLDRLYPQPPVAVG